METYRNLLKMAVKQQQKLENSSASAIARADQGRSLCEVGTEASCRGMVKFLVYASEDLGVSRQRDCDAVYLACKAAVEREEGG